MKLYIAGPVTGIPDDNRPAFQAAAAALTAAGYDPFDPTACGRIQGWGWADYMRRALFHMLDCDAVALLDGWRDSRGASLEVHVAERLGMPVRLVDAWLATETAT